MTLFRWLALAAVVAAAAATPLAAQESTNQSINQLTPWRHGAVQPKGDAGFWWMTAEGGFARQQGVDLRMTGFDSDIDMVKALQSNRIDSFEGSPISAMIATSKGGDLKIVGCSWPKLTFSFFAHDGIGSLADLRGKTIGVSSPGALPELVARAMLGRVAIESHEVKFVEAGNDTERVRAVAARRIDAAVSASDLAARTDLHLKVLARAVDILPSFTRACVVTRGDTWRKRSDDLVPFATAMMLGYEHALGHRAETVALARRIAKLPAGDPTPEASFDDILQNHAISTTLEIDVTKLLWLRDFLVEENLIDQDFEPGTMIDRGIRESALARLKGR